MARQLPGSPIATAISVRRPLSAAIALAATLWGMTSGAALPPDVRSTHWAAPAVNRTVKAGVLRVQADGQFHGEARVTRSEVAIAIAALGKQLLQGSWSAPGKAKAVPDSVATVWTETDWKTAPVRRYTLAAIVARLADYITVAVKRPSPSPKLGRSEILQPIPAASLQAGPGLEAMKYLNRQHMLRPDSPLLKPDSTPLTGGELSKILAEFTDGVNDQMTALDSDEDEAPKKK
jgi:hypothetical protein